MIVDNMSATAGPYFRPTFIFIIYINDIPDIYVKCICMCIE